MRLVSDLQLCFESSNQRVTVGTSVSGILQFLSVSFKYYTESDLTLYLETVHTERNPGHQTAADGTEDASSDPRHCPSLRGDRGGHQGPAVWAGDGHWSSS